MDAYDKGLEGQAAEWAVNKFKSHHQIPENIERLMEINEVRGTNERNEVWDTNEANETNH